MNTTYGIIWRILNALDLSLDLEQVPAEELTPERFKISKNRFDNYIVMLKDAWYIEGVRIISYITMERPEVDISEIKITLKGIQFLIENSMMNRIAAKAQKIGYTVAEFGITSLLGNIGK